jgi:hypothetical protein
VKKARKQNKKIRRSCMSRLPGYIPNVIKKLGLS